MAAILCQIPTFHFKLSFSPLPYRRNANHSHLPSIPRFQNSIFASIKKPRGSRLASRRSADLCNDIRDFLSVAGLPHDHIPTTNELRQHGRQDLANVVRRRGYKYIRELLGSLNKSFDGQGEEMKNANDDVDGGVNSVIDEVEFKETYFAKGQGEEMKNANDDVDGGVNSVIDEVEFKETYFAEDSSYPSLQDKASKFIQNGELDSIDDSDYEFLNQSSATHKEHKEHGLHRGLNGVVVSNGKILSSLQQVDHAVQEISVQKDAYPPAENKGVNVKIQNVENQAEISHLKLMLHKKELELMQLKQKIEAERNALYDMQIKAQTEMRKAHKLVSEKDAELNAAEQSLSGLKEVEIQFRGDGACVEVAGSFNGWHHRIKMDPQTASSLIGSTGLRVFHLWRTVLWLYPGVYEIKFVVDGHWRTDPERELVCRGAIENNVLRVER